MNEAPSNKSPLNQVALRWLEEAKASPDPYASYLAQLAWWGLEKGIVEVQSPRAPSQPSPHNLENLVETLVGADPVLASRWIVINPNVAPDEQAMTLLRSLRNAESSQDAARLPSPI